MQGTGQKLLGLDFHSDAGLLSSEVTADPFGFFLANTSREVALGALGANNAVTLDGEVITPVRYAGVHPETDLTAAWGDLNGNSIKLDVTLEVPDVSAYVQNGRIVLEGTGQQLLGLDVQSKAGLLSNAPAANPFDFYLSETPQHISLGVLGPNRAVMLDGSVVTSISYSGSDPGE